MRAQTDDRGRLRAATRIARVALAALALAACDGGGKPSASKQRGLSDWLVECSPFGTYDGGKVLVFDYDGGVDLDRGDNKSAWDKSAPEHVSGKWSGEEEGVRAEVDLPGKPPVHYVLQLPAGGHTCLLAATPATTTDLRARWFGALHAPDGEDEEDP